jgi:PadR family transcriptional regulator, regulatory protein PadR
MLAVHATLSSMEDQALATALRRGTLEFCVLALLAERELYGLELVRRLSEAFEMTASEGTLYPLLSRLRRTGRIASTWRESPSGPPRRYYTVTPEGKIALAHFRVEWVSFRRGVDRIMGTEQV